MKKMTEEQKEYLEQEHNVYIDAETWSFNINDEQYGWRAIPQDWIDDLNAYEAKYD